MDINISFRQCLSQPRSNVAAYDRQHYGKEEIQISTIIIPTLIGKS